MPPNNCDSEPTTLDPVAADHGCPKCGAEMEPIESTADAPPFEQLQLCPSCYLVMWHDQDGLHVRQGVPMREDANPPDAPSLGSGEPEKC